jgi:hypothetical protein
MAYTQQIGTHAPGLLIILIDQSGSMADTYGGTNKAQFAATAANRCIYEIVLSCTNGETVKPRCHIAAIGYGATTQILMGGKASELDAQIIRQESVRRKVSDGAGGLIEVDFQMPIWVEPAADGGTPMSDAFDLASDLIEVWSGENPNSFPPIVINITDGEPNDANRASSAAKRLTSLGTSDGTTLLLNGHIGEGNSAELKLPASDSQLNDSFARLMFGLSSVLPPKMVAAAQNSGFSPATGARGFLMNASAESLIKLLTFGSSVLR